MKRSFNLIVIILVILAIASFSYLYQDKFAKNISYDAVSTTEATSIVETSQNVAKLNEDSPYYDAKDVALYIDTYGKLPVNYLTKDEAFALGWDNDKGNLWEITDQKVIGGDRFGNREGLLPDKPSRIWYECDVNYEGGYRNAERLVFSNDGLIYYTSDHYASFEKLYE